MKNKIQKNFYTTLLSAFVVVLCVISIHRQNSVNKSVKKLCFATEQTFSELCELSVKIQNLRSENETSVNTLTESISKDLATLAQKTERLADQKVLADEAKSKEVQKILQKADELYSKKAYAESTARYNTALTFYPADNSIRIMRAKSAFYANPLNKNSYNEILSDIQIVSNSGKLDPELLKIRDIIYAETGVLKNEQNL